MLSSYSLAEKEPLIYCQPHQTPQQPSINHPKTSMSNPALSSTMRQSQQTPDTTTVRPHTWSQSSTPCKLKTNLIHKSQSNIKDQDSVQQWLIKQELIIPSKQVTAAILTMALLYISSSKYDQKELINGSRAVTICLENLHLPPNSEVIVAKWPLW